MSTRPVEDPPPATRHHAIQARYFLAGHLGGMAGVIAGQPFDVLKVKMQVVKKNRYRGMGEIARALLSRDGLRGLYRGLSSPLIAVGVHKALAFGVYGSVAEMLRGDKEKASLGDICVAGAAGGAANALILTPVDQLKIAMQTQKGGVASPLKRGLLETSRHVVRKFGFIRAMYGSFPAVLLREIPGYSIYFLTYTSLQRSFHIGDRDFGSKLLAGGATGVFMWGAYYPLDMIKSKSQVANVKMDERRTVRDIFRSITTKRGVMGLYRGVKPALLRSFPTHAAVLVVYDSVLNLFPEGHV